MKNECLLRFDEDVNVFEVLTKNFVDFEAKARKQKALRRRGGRRRGG